MKCYFLCDKRIITLADGLLQSWKKSSVRGGLTKLPVQNRKSCHGGNKKGTISAQPVQIISTLRLLPELLGKYLGAEIVTTFPVY